MSTKLISASVLLQAMQEANDNLADGYADIVSIAKNFKSDDWAALEKFGPDEAEGAREKVFAAGVFMEDFLSSFFIEPYRKLIKGELLTEPEFHTMLAIKAVPNYAQMCGVTSESEFRTYQLLQYNGGDDGPRGTIMTDIYKASRRSKNGIRPFEICPIQPEEVCCERLYQQQEQFFRRHFPSEFMRMKN
jgi:hypothetical protein